MVNIAPTRRNQSVSCIPQQLLALQILCQLSNLRVQQTTYVIFVPNSSKQLSKMGLDVNATFGAFTWDSFGDDERIPDWPNREIDFEDGRWGNPADPTNSQTVVQPYYVSGNLQRLTLPDLSDDASLTRFFTWSPGRIEFYTLLGHHQPNSFPPEAIIDHSVYSENLAAGQIVPEPGRENFRFNLWLLDTSPNDNQPVEVVINDFQFFLHGDFDLDGKVDGNDFLKWQQGESPDPFSVSDLAAWEQNYGTVAPLSAGSAAVPEPATWIVLMVGMMAILFLRDLVVT